MQEDINGKCKGTIKVTLSKNCMLMMSTLISQFCSFLDEPMCFQQNNSLPYIKLLGGMKDIKFVKDAHIGANKAKKDITSPLNSHRYEWQTYHVEEC